MPIFTGTTRFVQPNALLNSVNDALAGGVQNSVSGIQIARDPGQLGGYYYLTQAEATQRYGALAAPLFAGLYQYVQCVSSATSTPPARGQGAYWSVLPTSYTNSLQNYIATSVVTAENESFFAGVWLNAVTPGNFGWIQVSGMASVLYKGTFTGTAAIGVVVSSDPAPGVGFDVPLQTPAQIPSITKIFVGTAITLPVVSTIGQVLLKGVGWTF